MQLFLRYSAKGISYPETCESDHGITEVHSGHLTSVIRNELSSSSALYPNIQLFPGLIISQRATVDD